MQERGYVAQPPPLVSARSTPPPPLSPPQNHHLPNSQPQKTKFWQEEPADEYHIRHV